MSSPIVARTRAELQVALKDARTAGRRVALVPTMGALHAGHVALVRAARGDVGPAGAVVVSIFVNPMQFGPEEDLDRYPRTFDADLDTCAAEGVDVVFAPTAEEVYPGGDPVVTVDPGPAGRSGEGRSRPGHLRGVLTVVAKLFGLVGPDVAFFGEKDYEQLTKVRRMVADLCIPVQVAGVPTVREPDGLALSSRNRHLTDQERASALALNRALRAGADAASEGAEAVLEAAWKVLSRAAEVEVDYVVLADPDLDDAPETGPARLLVAARVGSTRLIDNAPVTLA